MATPHNMAEKGEFAEIVLMPGDPLRAKLIAETYLDDHKLVNEVRGMFGYTGYYHGTPISVMSSGMGMPSIGIYTYELFTEYDVQAIIRIGSAGAYVPELKLGDVVLVEYAWSESTFALVQSGETSHMLYPSKELNKCIKDVTGNLGHKIKTTPVHSSDVFYRKGDPDYYKAIRDEHQCSCVEMESFALFQNARALGKEAACLLTISDSFVSEDKMSAQERQTSFHRMIQIALEAAVNYK